MKRLIALMAAVMFCSVAAAQMLTTYFNPVIKGDVPDPTIIRFGEWYYAAGTSSEWAPHYPIFKSQDLVGWEACGHIFAKKPEWTKSSFWAPELFVHNGKVYAYYTARKASDNVSCIGVAVADSPESEFIDYGPVVEFGSEAIDAFVLEDNGELYISWKAYGLDKRPIELLASKLSADGLELEGEPFSLLVDEEQQGMEGQHWLKIGDYYYIVYAVKGCCGPGSDYEVAVARSKSLRGPYEKYSGNPILKGDAENVLSIGHGTIVTAEDGRMYYMCHAYLRGERFYAGRQPFLQEIALGEDGWLHFVEGDVAKLEHKRPSAMKEYKWRPSEFMDDFSAKKLRPEWSWNYIGNDVKTSIRRGRLLLSGKSLGDRKVGTVLALRPEAANYYLMTTVTNRNDSWKGIVFYGDERNLMTLGCKGDKIMLKMVKDGVESIIATDDLPKGRVELSMVIQQGTKAFFDWVDAKGGIHRIGERDIDLHDLVRWDRVARPGLYHEGDVDAPAVFESVEMGDFFWIR